MSPDFTLGGGTSSLPLILLGPKPVGICHPQPCDTGAPGHPWGGEPRTRAPCLGSLLEGPTTLPSGGSEDGSGL